MLFIKPFSMAIPTSKLVTDLPTDWDVTKSSSSLVMNKVPSVLTLEGKFEISLSVIPLKSDPKISPSLLIIKDCVYFPSSMV